MEKKKIKKRRFKIKPWMIETSVYGITALFFYYMIVSTKFLPTSFLIALAFIFIAVEALIFALTFSIKRKVRFIIGTVIAVIGLLINCFGGFYVNKTVSVLRAVASANTEQYSVNFYVLKDNPAENLSEIQNGTFGILSAIDKENTEDAIQKVEDEDGFVLNTSEYQSLPELADAITNGQVDGIILNEALMSIYSDTPGYESFPDSLKVVSTEVIEREVEASDEDTDKDVFTVLISGSDTRNKYLGSNGRSDVNILAVINRNTHNILLVSTPRDYFVQLALPGGGSGMDKLTHAGIYGVDCSMNTIGNLYGVNIDYYFRINFTGFIDLIDALGGIDVYSEYSFESDDGYYYQQGYNTVDGEKALSFARERHAFSSGDRQRGNNQMEVIKAVLNKAMSPSILKSYTSILQSLEGCMDMSIPYDLIAGVVNDQLNNNSSWNIQSTSVDGTGSYSSTYSMGNQQLYVMIPDQATVDAAKQQIQMVLESTESEG